MTRLIAVILFCAGIFCLAQSHAQVPMTGAGLGAPASSGGGGCSQSASFIARTSGLSANEITGYQNAICYWVAQGVYSNIDAAYILATNNTTTAVLNLVTSGTFDGVLTIGGGTFTVDRGITGDGSSTVISTGFTPSTSGGNYGGNINTGFLGAYDRTSDATGDVKADIGTSSGGDYAYIMPLASGSTYSSINAPLFTDNATNTNTQGNYIVFRTGASSTTFRKNEGPLTPVTNTTTVTAFPTNPICILGIGAGGGCGGAVAFTTRQVAAAIIGGGLTTTAQADAIAHGFNLYMTSVGANVY